MDYNYYAWHGAGSLLLSTNKTAKGAKLSIGAIPIRRTGQHVGPGIDLARSHH